MEEGATFQPRAILVADMVGATVNGLRDGPVATYATFSGHVRHMFDPAVRERRQDRQDHRGQGRRHLRGAAAAENAARDIQRRIESEAAPELCLPLSPRRPLRRRHDAARRRSGHRCQYDDAHAGLAPSGGICISGDLFQRLQEPSRARYTYAGSRYLKKIPDPVDVYLCRPDLETTDRPRCAGYPGLRRSALTPLHAWASQTCAFAATMPRHVLAALAQDALALEGLARFRDVLVVSPLGAVAYQPRRTPRASGARAGARIPDPMAHVTSAPIR